MLCHMCVVFSVVLFHIRVVVLVVLCHTSVVLCHTRVVLCHTRDVLTAVLCHRHDFAGINVI